MTQAPASAQQPRLAMESLRSVLSGFIDPPDAWNPTVGLFIGGYVLAGVTIWGWFVVVGLFLFFWSPVFWHSTWREPSSMTPVITPRIQIDG